jgi:tetratricopeptide (TPR) repeat protein
MLTKSSSDAPALDLDAPPADAPQPADAEDPKKAEKARKKREKKEKAAREREERALRKVLRAGSGTSDPSADQGASALKETLASPKRLGAAAVALFVLIVVVLGVRAGSTPAGFFWLNRVLPGKRAATAAEAKVIETGMQRLSQGDFASAREAVAAGAQLLGVLPDDEEVKAFFVLAASELKLEYDQAGSDFDQAKRVVERMTATRPAQNRARAAFALASGDFAQGRQLLAGLADAANPDPESAWLYAQSLIRSGDPQRAATVLDAALKAHPDAVKLLLLRGQVAHLRGQDKEAASFFTRVLDKSPDNGRALVELAAVRESQKDDKGAQELLARALDSDLRKTLDAGDDARANTIRGDLAAAAHDPKTAETAYERAVLLDPASATVREAYGKFRLARREWDKAARQFEAAIGGGSGSAEAYAGAAAAHLGVNRLLEADKEINQAVGKDPANAHYIYLQGRVAEAIGKGDEAFKKYEAALAKKPGSAEALAAEGQMLILRGDRAKAKEKLAAAVAAKESGRTALEDEATGDLALALGDKAAAQSLFNAALALDPQDPMAHAGLGKALAAQGDAAGAKKELEIALAQVDGDAGIQYEYGSVLRTLGQSDAALQALRKAVALDPKESRYHARLGALLVERGQYEDAEKELRQAVLIDGKNAEAQYFLGRALAGRKNLSEAVDTLHKAVNIEPDNATYLYWLGVVYEMGQQIQDAIDSFQKSIDKDPNNADALEHLGSDLMIENRFSDAVKAFKRAAEVDPKRARLWAEVGDAEQQSGDVDGAIRDFQRALAQDGKLTGVWTKLGVAYKDKDCKGCRARAEDALQHAVQVDTKDAAAHHELGYMYKDDGKRKEAIAEFQRYLDLRPDAGDVSSVQDDIYYLQEESRRAP